MKYFSMDSLNRKALNKITMLHKMVLNHSSELGNGFDLPLCREKNGSELSSKDFETLFGTYCKWRVDNGLPAIVYNTRLYEVGNVSTTEKSVSMEIFAISLAALEVKFEVGDIPTEFAKRDGKSEKAKTEANKKKGNNNNPSEPTPTSEPSEPTPTSEPSTVSPSEELDNEEKALENSAKKFNGEVVKDIQEVSMRRIGLIFGVDWKDMTKEQKNSLADALNEFVTMLDKGSVM